MNSNQGTITVTVLLGIGLMACEFGDDEPMTPDTGVSMPDSGTSSGDSGTPGVDAGTNCPGEPSSWAGVYDSNGSWELTGPINQSRGLSDVLADLVTDQAISVLGVPSALEDQARGVLDSALREPLKNAVDGSAPDTFIQNDPYIMSLTSLAADVQVKSTIELEDTGSLNDVSGREDLISLGVTRNGQAYEIDPRELTGGAAPPVPVAAAWEGTRVGSSFEIDEHEFGLRYGEIILWLTNEVLGTDVYADFEMRLQTAIDCTGTINDIVGNSGGIGFSIGITDFYISTQSLVDACQSATGSVLASGLGLFTIDSGIRLGGTVQLEHAACQVTALETAEPFTGLLSFVGPDAVQPRIYSTFRATRQESMTYADLRNSLGTADGFPIRGRIVREPEAVDLTDATPYRELMQDELRNVTVQLSLVDGATEVPLDDVTCDGEGYIDAIVAAPAGIAAGRYEVRVEHEGALAGVFQVRLIQSDRAAPVLRSDIDKTYLESDFESTAGIFRLLTGKAASRTTLPAMDTLYQQIRGTGWPLTFLSGSPRFFTRALEGKMQLDQVEQDGVFLKPFKDIVAGNLASLDLTGIVPELKEQVGYKLLWLLRARLEIPAATPEVLLGDDSEADFIVYSLYERFMDGTLDQPGLMAELATLEVDATWSADIEAALPSVQAHVTAPEPIAASFIRRAHADPNPDVQTYRTARTRYHDGTWPIALDFFEAGWLTRPEVDAIRAELTARSVDETTLRGQADAGVADGFLDAATVTAFHN